METKAIRKTRNGIFKKVFADIMRKNEGYNVYACNLFAGGYEENYLRVDELGKWETLCMHNNRICSDAIRSGHVRLTVHESMFLSSPLSTEIRETVEGHLFAMDGNKETFGIIRSDKIETDGTFTWVNIDGWYHLTSELESLGITGYKIDWFVPIIYTKKQG
jgi:hypothetical protein